LAVFLFLFIFLWKFFAQFRLAGEDLNRVLLVFGATLLISAVGYRLMLFMLPLVFNGVPFQIQGEFLFLGLPFGMGALVIAFLFNLPYAVIFSFINAWMGGIVCGWNLRAMVWIWIGNLALCLGIEQYQRLKRSSVLKACFFWLLPVSVVFILAFFLTDGESNVMALALNIGLAIMAALLTILLANFVIPVWEALFGLVTDLKLVEITNLNLPPFREMLEKAPGTYHHSLMVASLSEAAAQDLAISPLLLRAKALYHDIGKNDNPQFFTENHSAYENPHPRMSPQDSARAIISHISGGLERAERLKLPKQVKDAIVHHHGTRLVRFFYEKAREAAEGGGDEVDENAYRYPGRKPSGIEDAIIMLADQIEAASKSLAAPTDEEIKNVIEQIISTNITENQFDDCEHLTIKALKIIAASFFEKLTSIYHQRVSYPGFDFTEKENS
jgi:cyclic-di-AMP phosphodiesterase PgpH